MAKEECLGDIIKMTAETIRNIYDSNPNLTLGQLSAITGLSIAKLKRILMG